VASPAIQPTSVNGARHEENLFLRCHHPPSNDSVALQHLAHPDDCKRRIPPAEAEANYYRQLTGQATLACLISTGLLEAGAVQLDIEARVCSVIQTGEGDGSFVA
jgi:hypothetical protein